MAKQVLHYLREVYSLDLKKCRGQSYDNAASMSWCYKGIQQIFLEENKFAMCVPCGAH